MRTLLRCGPGLLLTLVLWCTPSAAAPSPVPVEGRSLERREAVERLRERHEVLRPERWKQSQQRAFLRRDAPSELRVLVVGCDFSDSLLVGRDRSQFPGWPEPRRIAQRIAGTGIPMFSAHDSTYFDLQMRRVDEYYRSVSFGQLEIDWDVHGELVNLPEAMGWYGDPDSSDVRAVRMADQVVAAVDDDVDFSAYDTLVLIHAGAGSETDILGDSPEQIPSNYLDRRDFEEAALAGLLGQAQLLSDEGAIEHVLVLPEAESQDPLPSAGLSGFFDVLGVYCFEFGLRLGMLSLSDFTPPGSPDSQGIGNFGLMGFGLFTGLSIVPSTPCAMNRMLMGWVEPVEVEADADLRLGPMNGDAHAAGDTLLYRVPINDREYWLLEYRLQDPNGDLFYTFGDSNQNRVPDFWDDDSEFGNGWPTSPYDPAVDVWERTLGSEWDWFMSENPARTDDRCMRAGGSGVYVYHIDERVIENSILSGVNTINADPTHKGVDVEEADGIQDLDSSRPSAYILGWDGDAWRGEGGRDFGPDTVPATDTASGLPTGIRFSDFSTVKVDSLPRNEEGECTGFEYRAHMSFRVDFEGDGSQLTELARRRYDDGAPVHAPRVVDLGGAPSDPAPDAADEIVLAADGGRVLVFRDGLEDWLDGDGDPLTVGVLAEATESGGDVQWQGDPAVVDLDDDGSLDLILSSGRAVHAFSTDGEELFDGDADPSTRGVLVAFEPPWRPRGAPVVAGTSPAVILQLLESDGQVTLARIEWDGSEAGVQTGPPVEGRLRGDGALVPDPAEPRLVVGWSDAEGPGLLLLPSEGGRPPQILRTGPIPASSTPLTWAESAVGAVAYWTDRGGRTHRTQLPPPSDAATTTPEVTPARDLPGDRLEGAPSPMVGVASPDGPRFARVAGGRLHGLDAALADEVGFPYDPRAGSTPAVTDSLVAPPVLVDLGEGAGTEILWHDGEGVLHAVDARGRALDTWPVAGPAEPSGSPAVGDVDGDGSLDLVVVGRFSAIDELLPVEEDVRTVSRGEIRVYSLERPSEGSRPWAQARGGVLNRSVAEIAAFTGASEGERLLEESLSIRPNPAVGASVRVRVEARRDAAVTAILYDLTGEEIARRGPVDTEAGTAFDEEFDITALVPGMYLCRVVAGSDAVVSAFAVAR